MAGYTPDVKRKNPGEDNAPLDTSTKVASRKGGFEGKDRTRYRGLEGRLRREAATETEFMLLHEQIRPT